MSSCALVVLIWVHALFLGSVAAFGRRPQLACHRLRNLAEAEDHIFSQYGEDGVLIGLLDTLGLDNSSRYYVEFGVEDGVQCNSRILREMMGFTGLSMDGGFSNSSINLNKEFVLESNIISLFQKYSVPPDLEVLSIDVDMFDFWILAKIFQYGYYKPRVIVVETNPSLCVSNIIRDYKRMNDAPLTVTHPSLTEQSVWDGTRYAGANPRAFQQLASQYGYDMVHCERCGVNCFLVRRDAIPEMCRDEFVGRVPQIPYPCFSTLNANVPGGTMIGHPLDGQMRLAIELSSQVAGNKQHASLLATITSKGLLFDPHQDIQSSHQHACNAEYPEWGAHWWDHVIEWKENLYSSQTVQDVYIRGYEHFYEGDYEKALAKFTLLVDLKNKVVQDEVVLKSVAEESFGKCHSKHYSELSCLGISNTYFNVGIALLHLAVGAQEVDEKDYLELTRDALEQAQQHVSNSGNGYVEKLNQMVHFLSFLLNTFQQSPRSGSINNILNQCAQVGMQISFVSESIEADGSDGIPTTVVETHKAEVCTCDSIDQEAELFCEKHSIGNCEVTFDRLLIAMNNQVFEGIPYNLLSILNPDKAQNAQIEASIRRSRGYKGWTRLPEVFHKLTSVAHMSKCR